jgi:hypothetical protein
LTYILITHRVNNPDKSNTYDTSVNAPDAEVLAKGPTNFRTIILLAADNLTTQTGDIPTAEPPAVEGDTEDLDQDLPTAEPIASEEEDMGSNLSGDVASNEEEEEEAPEEDYDEDEDY